MLAGFSATWDWYAVEQDKKRIEYIAKPATTLCIFLAAFSMLSDHDTRRAFVIVGLAFCLLGDVFLMLPRDRFVFGLASFLVAHVLFIAGFVLDEPRHTPILTMILALPFALVVLPRVLRAVRATEPKFFAPVLVYAIAILAMFMASGFTGHSLAIAGAAVFVASDTLIAWNRFVRPLPHGQLAIMTTYHAALVLLVVSLAQIG